MISPLDVVVFELLRAAWGSAGGILLASAREGAKHEFPSPWLDLVISPMLDDVVFELSRAVAKHEFPSP